LTLQQVSSIVGTIKNYPEDFVVDEIPLYEPCNEGEHLYISVRKTNMSHDELIRLVAKEFGVHQRAMGCAGRKDLRATTSQVLSVHLPAANPDVPERIGNIVILSSARHTNKLRLGHLVGNRFSIKIRDISSDSFTDNTNLIQERLQRLSITGLPNAFGYQRFGNTRNNHEFGLLLVQEHWDRLIELLLSGDDPCHAHARNGDFQRALDAWPFGHPAERAILASLAKGVSSVEACARIAKPLRKLWVNAMQSKIFNTVLESRIEDATWDTLLIGDLVWNHKGGGRTFEALEEEIYSEDLQSRLKSIAISPSGPLWGAKMRKPSGGVLRRELEVLTSFGLDESIMQSMRSYAVGARRPLRVQVGNPQTNAGIDQHGQYVDVQFALPAGSYASVVIEHILNVSL